MKRAILTLVAIAATTCIQAQLADLGRPERLLEGVQSDLYYPVLNADGTRLLFSDVDYSRLRMYDFTDNVTVTVSADARSGFGACFSADGRSIEFTKQTTRADGLNLRTACSYDIDARSLKAKSQPAHDVAVPASTTGGVTVETEGSSLIINGRSYSPVDCYAGYLWASASPDGSKVMFVAAGKGVYVTNLQGQIIAYLGKYEAPVWYGNDHVVAMLATDDGHQFSSSQIVLMDLKGHTQELTRPESMSMFPAASIQAGKVIWNTIDGRLYQLEVKLR